MLLLARWLRARTSAHYVAEREARDAEAKGEEVNGEDRAQRIREALEQARQDTNQVRQQNGLDQPPSISISNCKLLNRNGTKRKPQKGTTKLNEQAAEAEGRFQACCGAVEAGQSASLAPDDGPPGRTR